MQGGSGRIKVATATLDNVRCKSEGFRMKRDHIIQEIKRTAMENGDVPLGRAKFYTETGIRETEWQGIHWARWSDALREAGFEPNSMNQAYESDWLLDQFISLMRELGRWPVATERRLKAHSDSNFPSHNTFNRFGSKIQFAGAIVEYCSGKPGYDDIVAICEPVAVDVDAEDATTDSTSSEAEEFGYVYLAKQGRNYKIGRSNAVGRRMYELGTKSAEPVNEVHSFRTDDPAGIEKYWHDRFRDKRIRAEWFSLDQTDVKAFKRRKYFM